MFRSGENSVGLVPLMIPSACRHSISTLAKLVAATSANTSAVVEHVPPCLRHNLANKAAVWARVICLLGEKVVGLVPLMIPSVARHSMSAFAK